MRTMLGVCLVGAGDRWSWSLVVAGGCLRAPPAARQPAASSTGRRARGLERAGHRRARRARRADASPRRSRARRGARARVSPRAGSLLPDGPAAASGRGRAVARWSAHARSRSIAHRACTASVTSAAGSSRRRRPTYRALLEAYAAGVNAGLAALGARAARVSRPARDTRAVEARGHDPDRARDVQHAAGPSGAFEATFGTLADTVPPAMYDFLTARGSEWDAPVDGRAASRGRRFPAPDVFDLRRITDA